MLTYDLMQHETLAMDLDADPLDVTVNLWLGDVDRDDVSAGVPRLEVLHERVVVEVAKRATRQISRS